MFEIKRYSEKNVINGDTTYKLLEIERNEDGGINIVRILGKN